MSTAVVYLDGRFVSPDEARVSVDHRGYLHGDGVFATMHGYDGVCFRAGAHLATLERGRELLGLASPPENTRLADLAHEAARLTGASHAYVRVTLARGVKDEDVVCSILARPLVMPSEGDFANGIAATIVTLRRFPPACMDPTVKTSSYAPQLLAKREVESRGAFEGIQLAVDGSLACGTTANLFLVMGDRLLTPPTTSGCRAGVTRGAVIELASACGLSVEETRLEPSALAEADEVFFTSTRVECLPIAHVDGTKIGNGEYPRTHALRKALLALVERETRGAQRDTESTGGKRA